jgi:hypothetical protein
VTEPPDLPPGYHLDEASDPDVVILRRRDGTEVAAFSADGATAKAIEETAWRDHGREGGTRNE